MKIIFVILLLLPLTISADIFRDPFHVPNEQNKQVTLSSDGSFNLDFQKTDIRQALQQLAKSAQKNMVISDQVAGEISLYVQKVTWQQALALLLRSQNLMATDLEGVLMITSEKEMLEQQREKNLSDQYADLVSEVVHLQDVQAGDLALEIKKQKLLTQRGKIAVNDQSNTLWISDNEQSLKQVISFIKAVDIPAQQILIKAEVVNVDDNYERELGISFSLNQSSSEPVKNTNNPLSGLSVDLTNGNTSSQGSAVIKLDRNNLLNLQLAALQSEGKGKIISSPRLLTANQQTATIQAGEEIPYQESTSSGATSVAFKKAVLSLQVTPQIMAHNKILLKLQVNQDKRSSQVPVRGVPAIDTREVKTQVLVENGQTVVLGGIYESIKVKSKQGIPGLMNLPGIGWLFRQNSQVDSRRQLLIFVTPSLVS